MLQTALQLARSLGKEETGGHATMGLWLGEMFERALILSSGLLISF
jgi:hypothetical protein